MRKKYILFIDSGIGGISTLCSAIKKINNNYIYYADNLHAPYGKLSKTQIFTYLKNIISLLKQEYNISVVVLACNTATTSAINNLRESFKDITFIGTEPAVMLAKKLNYKKIACIATLATVKQEKYLELCNSLNAYVKHISMPNLATNIEKYFFNPSINNYIDILKDIFYIKSKITDCDCLVLGCTHYVMIKDILKKYISIPLIDGNNGVVNLLLKTQKSLEKSSVMIFLSNNSNELKQKYIKILNQTLAKT